MNGLDDFMSRFGIPPYIYVRSTTNQYYASPENCPENYSQLSSY